MKTCHRGWLYTPFRVLFCRLFYFIHCCRFAIIESLPFELFFIFLWHRKACTVYVRTTHFMAHTIWSTLRMQLYILFFLSHCFDFSFFFFIFSSTSLFSFIPFPFMWLSLCWQHEKPAYSFDAFPVYDLQIREKEWRKNITAENKKTWRTALDIFRLSNGIWWKKWNRRKNLNEKVYIILCGKMDLHRNNGNLIRI